jgi:hypothetical protein
MIKNDTWFKWEGALHEALVLQEQSLYLLLSYRIYETKIL